MSAFWIRRMANPIGAKANYTRYLPGFHRPNSQLANFVWFFMRDGIVFASAFRFSVQVRFDRFSFRIRVSDLRPVVRCALMRSSKRAVAESNKTPPNGARYAARTFSLSDRGRQCGAA
ncbi:hypothetical protein QYH69_30005 [Paraburkholderia sp. SARCC-3016]|uniref:hypothetical protein n=1 Tax=Paraburkholderia sp. SARCC-3016 TaxID=3058611 RepID=UPI0028094342|nr:hypothetical protein [Paraburkholderia sp. SARCC-3016]MDQ7981464.1 hypothetical protein [Paraburkholderia sp. SARCC-3016]